MLIPFLFITQKLVGDEISIYLNKVKDNLPYYTKADVIVKKHYGAISSESAIDPIWIDKKAIENLHLKTNNSEYKYLLSMWDEGFIEDNFASIKTYENKITFFKYKHKDILLHANQYYVGIGSENDLNDYLKKRLMIKRK